MTIWNKYKIFIVIILIVIAGAAIPEYFAVTTTKSLNKRIYFINKGKEVEKLKTGNYVMFSLLKSKQDDLPAKLIKMIEDDGEELQIKRIGCSAGEEIKNIGNEYYCENELIARAKDYSLGGERMKKFEFTGKIPEGNMFLVGDHVDSYDSRYFGFIKAEDIIATLYPLL
jgi:conjugal transfer pilin signal peptidase TrbI